jgi:hypothetical protein
LLEPRDHAVILHFAIIRRRFILAWNGRINDSILRIIFVKRYFDKSDSSKDPSFQQQKRIGVEFADGHRFGPVFEHIHIFWDRATGISNGF